MAKEEQVDLQEVLVFVNRVAKVVKGGRRFSFAVLVVVGDGKGKFGFAIGKAKEVVEAKSKALKLAKKRMFKVPLREGRTLHYDVTVKYGAGKVMLRSAPAGTGVISGGAMRPIFKVLGVRDVVAKSLGSSNPYNMVEATCKALMEYRTPKSIAEDRNLKIGDLIERRDTQ
ncbi:MAG: 30S ribosomal protein S5 [Pseudomonadota bacterium]